MKAAYVGIDILYPALPALYDSGCDIVRIFTCETDNKTEFNTAVSGFALSHKIPLSKKKIVEEDLYGLLDEGCDFVLVGGYYYRIPVIDSLPIVNIHPALLPKGRGAWPMPVTILKGLTESGITFHRMSEGLDEGDILLQEKIPVYPDDDLKTLSSRQNACIPEMVKALIADFNGVWQAAYPQGDGAEYWKMPEEEDWTVTSDMTVREADLILRAFYGYECIYINRENGKRFELTEGKIAGDSEKSEGIRSFPVSGGYIVCSRVVEV